MKTVQNIIKRLKLRLPQSGWAYSFKCSSSVQVGDKYVHIFKVGHSKRANPMKRLGEFHGANRIEQLLLMAYVPDARRAETHILKELHNATGVVHLNHLGNEWWACESVELFNSHLTRIFSAISSSTVFTRPRRSARIANQKSKTTTGRPNATTSRPKATSNNH